jgi:hypothetical protein
MAGRVAHRGRGYALARSITKRVGERTFSGASHTNHLKPVVGLLGYTK